MRDVHQNFVLYSDVPQRHYRQIAAIEEDGAFMLQRWEGTALQIESFQHENPDSEVVLCSTVNEVIELAEKEHEASLKEGWHDYHPALD